MESLLFFVIAALVGVLGSMLGIGGGVFIIPILTLFLGVPIKTAIGASLVSVIATSLAASAVYVGHGMAHTRLAMILEVATTSGALIGSLLAAFASPRLLQALFAVILVYMVYSLRRLPKAGDEGEPTGLLDTSYLDPFTGKEVTYGIRRLPGGMAAGFVAGNVSGLLGIGSGIIKVPIMALVMGMPLKAAIATSNFMIGVTAATSAIVYYARGHIDPQVAVLVALGVLVGAQVGPRLGRRTRTNTLKLIFQGLLLIFAVQMLWKAIFG